MKTSMKILLGLVVLAILAFAGTALYVLPNLSKSNSTVAVQGTLSADVMGEPLQLTLNVTASGSSADSLSGNGTINDAACGKSIVTVQGAINGDTLTLSGSVTQGIDTPELKDTPVNIVADKASGNITLTFGPISSGLPLSGQTYVFAGSGTVQNK